MNTRILGGNPSREKTTAVVAQPSIFYYRENILQHMCWCRLLPARKHPPALVYQPLLEWSYDPLLSFTSLSWKGATTPCSHLLASPGRELWPPALIYQPHLEGSYNPLTEGYNPQHLYGPCFINFHTGSKASFRTPLAGHISSYFQTGPFPYF